MQIVALTFCSDPVISGLCSMSLHESPAVNSSELCCSGCNYKHCQNNTELCTNHPDTNAVNY